MESERDLKAMRIWKMREAILQTLCKRVRDEVKAVAAGYPESFLDEWHDFLAKVSQGLEP